MKTPFVYLGLQVGGNPRRLQFWNPILSKLRQRLSRWRRKTLSFGGRICLINSTLSSIPLFYLSFFKMPIGVEKECNRIMKNFLWGSSNEEQHKVAWVKWDIVTKPKMHGGLGIRNWGDSNRALLGKWRWGLCEEHQGLWARIIRTKYNCHHGTLRGLVRPSASVWWKDIVKVCFDQPLGSWFDGATARRIGEGNRVRFWLDVWVGEEPFADKFPRLFQISTQQPNLISELGHWHNNEWRWEFSWRRNLRDWEKTWLEELLAVISQLQISRGVSDRWIWKDDVCGGYSVKSAYIIIRNLLTSCPIPAFVSLWKALTPSSVKAFMWKLLWGRIQSKENLARRGILAQFYISNSNSTLNCVFCDDSVESVGHLMFSCRKVSLLWYACYKWLGFSTVLPEDSQMHFLQHTHGSWNAKQRRVWWAIWGAVVWTVWCARNKLIFSNEVPDWEGLMCTVQWRAWIWTSSMVRDFRCSMSEWNLDPCSCIAQLR